MYKHICVQRLLVVRDGTHISCPMHAHSVSTIIRLSTYITPKRICIIAQALQHCNVPQVNLVSPSKSTSGCRFCNTTRRMHEHIELHVKVLKHCIRFVYFLHLGGLKRCDTFTFGSQTLGSGGFGAVADGKRTSPRAGHLTFFASSHDTHKHFMSVSLTLIEAAPIVLALLLTRS